MKTKIDSIIANVKNMKAVLHVLYTQLSIKPFHRSVIQIDGVPIEMALLHLGNVDLELIACGNHPAPTDQSCLSIPTIETPVTATPQILHLEEQLNLQLLPGNSLKLTQIDFQSSSPLRDAEILLHCFSGSSLASDDDQTVRYTLDMIDFIFHCQDPMDNGNTQRENIKTEQGWRRVSFAIQNLEEAVATLNSAGTQVVISPFTVLPGLREAMLSLPSGLIIQPVEQNLPQMLLHLILEKTKSLFNKTQPNQ